MASWTFPFTYEAVEVIFGSIYFYFYIQTAPNLQDCPHSDNLPTFPESTLCYNYSVLNLKAVVAPFNKEKALVGAFSVIVQLHRWIDLRHYSGYTAVQKCNNCG